MAGELLLDPAEHSVAPADELRARQFGPEAQVASEIGAASGQSYAAEHPGAELNDRRFGALDEPVALRLDEAGADGRDVLALHDEAGVQARLSGRSECDGV